VYKRQGLRVTMERAGYEAGRKQFKGYRVIRELVSQGGERGARYSLLLNGELAGTTLTISDSIFKALSERYGENYVMEDIITKSFVKLPKEVEIDKVYDLDGMVVWSKFGK